MNKQKEEASRISGAEPVQPGNPVTPSDPVLFYQNPAGSEYPVVAYNNVQLEHEITVNDSKEYEVATDDQIRSLLNTVKTCGFNVNLWRSGRSNNQELLNRYFDIAESLGLRTVLSIMGMMPVIKFDDELPNVPVAISYVPAPESLAKLLGFYKGVRNLWGYLLKDEPHYCDWGMVPGEMPEDRVYLPLGYEIYQDNNNGHVAFFNLAVSTAENYIGKKLADLINSKDNNKITHKTGYIRYLEQLDKKFNPLLMSVDVYPVISFGSNNNFGIKGEYYYSLEAIGEVSSSRHLPFWLFLLSNQHTIYKESGAIDGAYPMPNVGLLRFQAMTAIAFGIQGLVFWTYGMPDNKWFDKEETKIKEKYLDAPYVNGQTTSIWSYCRDVISEIKKYGGALLDAEYLGARHVYKAGSTYRFPETIELSGLFGCISSATAAGKGFVITHLKKGKTNYMAIVSHDYEDSQSITFSIPNTFDWKYVNFQETSGTAVQSENIETLSLSETAEIIRQTLKPGGMILISY